MAKSEDEYKLAKAKMERMASLSEKAACIKGLREWQILQKKLYLTILPQFSASTLRDPFVPKQAGVTSPGPTDVSASHLQIN